MVRQFGQNLTRAAQAIVLFTSLAPSAHAAPVGEPAIEPKVIYGDDDRRDIYAQDLNPQLVRVAQSTGILIRRESLITDAQNPQIVNVTAQTLENGMGVCANEPFHDQPAAGFCSGFLVGPDLFVTAGHCIKSQTDCDGTGIAFGFAYDTPSRDPKRLAKSDVYRCSSIVSRHLDPTGAEKLDYAVVKLDRPVVGHAPMKIHRAGSVHPGDGVTVLGYPSGIPLKIAGGAAVRSESADVFFVANLDTYGGNSGSAVVNSSTLEVEGILVRGERDYVSQNGCMISNRCPADGCRGEDVTKIGNIVSFVPALD